MMKERGEGPARGTANASGNFVFQPLSAEEAMKQHNTRSQLPPSNTTGHKRPASNALSNKTVKKPRTDRSLKSNALNSSIFKHL